MAVIFTHVFEVKNEKTNFSKEKLSKSKNSDYSHVTAIEFKMLIF